MSVSVKAKIARMTPTEAATYLAARYTNPLIIRFDGGEATSPIRVWEDGWDRPRLEHGHRVARQVADFRHCQRAAATRLYRGCAGGCDVVFVVSQYCHDDQWRTHVTRYTPRR